MEIAKITQKQIEIIRLIYRFRFLNSTQIQKFLNHQDKMRINLWLKDLCAKNYLKRIYSNQIGENSKPAIYFSGQNLIRHIKGENVYGSKYLKNLHRDNERSRNFIERQMFLADICLDLRNRNKYEYMTAEDCTSSSIYFFLESLSPQLLITKNKNKQYILFILNSDMPKYSVKKKIKNCIEFYYENIWEENSSLPFPTILFTCETKALLIYAKKSAKYLLEDYQNPQDLNLWFGLNEDIKDCGINAEIWEECL